MRAMTLFIFLLFAATVAGVSGCASWNAEKKAPMVGALININGHNLHVVDQGVTSDAKPPVVLIHGASVNLRDLKMSLGDTLANDRRVIMIDRPGRGYSDRPRGAHRLEVQAQYIRDAITELGVEKPIVVGQSLGGAVALSYALAYQEEMSGLVLLAPVSHEWPGGVAWYNNASQIPFIGFLLRRLIIPIYGHLAAEKGVEESFAPNIPPQDYAERSGLSLLFRANDFKSNAADVAGLKEQIISQQTRYGELSLPVVIVTGDADTTVSPELHSKTLAKQIDGASLTMLPDTGHALHHAETEIILEVIDGISSPGWN